MVNQSAETPWLDAADLGDTLQHISSLVATRSVSRGNGPVRVVRPSPRDVSAVSYEIDGETRKIGAFLRRSHTDGLMVLRGDEVLCETYFNGMTSATPHMLMSVSKAVAGMLAGEVLEATHVGTDTQVGAIVPELKTSGYGEATIQQVLDMEVNVEFRMDFTDPGSEVFTEDRAAGWRPQLEGDPRHTKAFLPTLRGVPRSRPTFQYCSATTDVLAWVLERVASQDMRELLAAWLWSRMGASHDAIYTVDSTGFPYAAAGLCATMPDIARFGRLLLDGGTWGSQEIVPKAWISETWSGPGALLDTTEPSTREKLRVQPAISYHNQWWRLGDGRGSAFVPGLLGQYIWLDPTSDVVIVKLSSVPIALDAYVEAEHIAALHSLAMSVGG